MNAPDPIARLNAALEGRYRIERELGEGGLAIVYLADELKHERKVALKVLKGRNPKALRSRVECAVRASDRECLFGSISSAPAGLSSVEKVGFVTLRSISDKNARSSRPARVA